MFAEYFFTILQFMVSGALRVTDHNIHRWYWCDGFFIPETSFFHPDDPVIETRAYIVDNHGHHKIYDCLLFLGEKSIAASKAGAITKDCIPDASESSWVYLDPEEKTIHIQLL